MFQQLALNAMEQFIEADSWLADKEITACMGLVVSVADNKHRGPGFDSRVRFPGTP
jgi:hypothetical protein